MKTLSLFIVAFTLLLNENSQSQNFTGFINGYVKEHQFNGTILIERDHHEIYHNSFGVANRQFGIPIKNDTKFKIASITKSFTAVLILQLYEEGKIDLNKTIKTYLPNYSGEGADKVTIHQLLNHTSGMTNMDNIPSAEFAIQNGLEQYQRPYTTDELLKRFCSGKLVHEPGKTFDYNNGEYIILGKIIEQISGKPYEQVLKERVLQPLGMSSSGLLFQYNVVENLADTYFTRPDLKMLANDLPVYIENWYAAGAMYSTARDLLIFSEALFNHQLLKQRTLELMLKPSLEHYGYSVWADVYEINKKMYNTIKRPGRIMGAQAMLFHIPDERLTIIILSNTDQTDPDDFVLEISKHLIK